MTYARLTKAQLIERIQTLEQSSLDKKVEQVKKELVLLGQDIVKLIKWTYEAGAKARKVWQANSLTTLFVSGETPHSK